MESSKEHIEAQLCAYVDGELNDALCGQLERASLLNPTHDETNQAILSINRWPQITAVASVLLLAVGLGIVVYYVLPPSTGTHGPVAIDEKHARKNGDGVQTGDLEKSKYSDVKSRYSEELS